jgi:microcystin-dependent protein
MDPFVAEIRILPFTFAPHGWAFCSGQVLPITQNTALFSLLGTNFGGDGRSNFALPNLGDRIAIHAGQSAGPGLTSRSVGEQGGSEAVTLTSAQTPGHSHAAQCIDAVGNAYGPAGDLWAADAAGGSEYAPTTNALMAPNALAPTGSSVPHNNLQPYLVMNYCIALQGIFPPRS